MLFNSIILGIQCLKNDEIIDFLRTWRNDLPDLPEINFDLTYQETFEEIKDLSPSVFRSLFDNDEIININFPIIFPERKTLYLLLGHFKDISESNSKNSTLYAKLHSKLEIILK